MAERVSAAAADRTRAATARGRRATSGSSPGPVEVDTGEPARVRRILSLHRPDPRWVDAAPFRAHLRHLMSVGRLDVAEVAVVLGLSTRAVATLLGGRAGRPTRRVSPDVARCLLLVTPAEVRGLRWCLAPAGSARVALARLLGSGWSGGEVARAVGFELTVLDELAEVEHCNRLLGVRLVGLARRLPGTIDDEDLVPVTRAA